MYIFWEKQPSLWLHLKNYVTLVQRGIYGQDGLPRGFGPNFPLPIGTSPKNWARQ